MYNISKAKAIRLSLHQQGLYHEPILSGKQGILSILESLGLIQIDSLNVVSKSHNLLFFSRLKEYSAGDLIELYQEKKVFESYVHAMSLLPINQYSYVAHRLHEFKQHSLSKLNQEEMDFVLTLYHKILEYGPLTTKEISSTYYKSHEPLATWEMSPVRWGLDQLWRSGMIQVLRDFQFNKLYVPSSTWMGKEIESPPQEEIHQYYCLSSLKAMGVATVKDIADYYRTSLDSVRSAIQILLAKNKIREIQVEHTQDSFYIRQEDEFLLSDDSLNEEPSHMCFLSPFDNLIWYRIRLMNLFGVDYRLESYIPKNQRKYGYFALPVLIKGQIIGTIDLKLERKKSVLVIQNLFLYNSFDANYFRDELQILLHRYAKFLNADHIMISDECWEKARLFQPLYSLMKTIV